MCIRINIFNFKNNNSNNKTKTKNKTKKNKPKNKTKIKEEKGISDENITEYDDNVSEFAQCTFNFLLVVMSYGYINLM